LRSRNCWRTSNRLVGPEINRYYIAERIMSARKVRLIFNVSLFILGVGILTIAWRINILSSLCAKELQNETPQNRPLVEITLRLEGKTVPGKPKVVSAENTFDALHEKTGGTSLEIESTGTNSWKCRGLEGETYVVGWIAEKGWLAKRSKMFGYRSEPFVASGDLTVPFSPGMPATFEYDLTNPPDDVHVFPAGVFLGVEALSNGKSRFSNCGGRREVSRPDVVRIEGLAGGRYFVLAQFRAAEKYSGTRTPVLYDRREVVEIKPGIVNHFEPVYPEVDTTAEEGDVTIRGTLYGRDKKPLAGKTVQLIPTNEKGAMPLYYPSVVTDSGGRFVFTGVRPNLLGVQIESGRANAELGKKSLRENNSVSVELVPPLSQMATEIGIPIEDISIEWNDGTTGRLRDFSGKIVVLDVWATWCAPCIRALPELNSLAAKVSGESNIVFVALSIDHDKAVWERMVEESNWKALKHGVLDRTKNSYVFDRPIPFTMVIDETGVVRAEGHGLDIGLELEKLAKTSGQSGDGTFEQ
jgi:thiol-disulfide isomerase/thioredoxin